MPVWARADGRRGRAAGASSKSTVPKNTEEAAAAAAAPSAARVRKTCGNDDDGPNFGRAFYSVRNDLEAVPRLE